MEINLDLEGVRGQIVGGIDYLTKKPVAIKIESDKISKIHTKEASEESDRVILPGLFDLQINGYAGVDFNSETLSFRDMEKAVIALARQGVTSFLPTIITNSREAIANRLRLLTDFVKQSKWGSFIAGFHLEGPFISPEDGPRGAHPKEHVKEPDWSLVEFWQQCADNKIKIITLSPEWARSEEIIRKCVDLGIKIAIGHTAANSLQISRAVSSGASLSTHLGNGAHPVLPRHPNYIWDQLANDSLWLSFIADGFHLPESVISVYLKVKKDKVMLVSDAVSFAGQSPGIYESLIGGKVELTENGRLQMVSDPRLLAGSASSLLQMIDFLVRNSLASFEEAWEMASIRPAVYLSGIEKKGFSAGSAADFVLGRFHEGQFEIDSVVKNGETVEF